MTSSPFKPLLDRDFAKAGAKEVIDIARPLLRELVNSATRAWRRCQVETEDGRKNEDLAALILFRQVIEMVDGIEVLIEEACSVSTVPLLRAAFEASLSLEYILVDDAKYVERSLSWFCVHIHRRITTLEAYDPATAKGADFKTSWEQSFGPWNPPGPTAASVTSLQNLLSSPELQPVEAEYQRCHQRKKNPSWYSLFGGPNDLRTLAQRLNRTVEYDVLYKTWSTVVHANDPMSYMGSTTKGETYFTSIRYPEKLANYAFMAATLLLRSTRLMIDKFRRGEPMGNWYLDNIREAHNKLAGLKVQVDHATGQ